jgi:hypothetical protein
MSDTNELIERTKIFEENIRETKIKMINLEHGLYKDILVDAIFIFWIMYKCNCY